MSKDFDKKPYFGSHDESTMGTLTDYIINLNDAIAKYRNYEHPFFKGDYSLPFAEYLEKATLNDKPLSPEKTFQYIAPYFANLPDWSNPGTMINVIPVVNIVSAAASSVTGSMNPNFAQDTYSGNLILSELEVVKYMSELIGWDWQESWGIFTFGGTGTNMYGTKLAIANADPESAKRGVLQNAYFMLTSKNGHPCHYQLCDWLGIGSDSSVEIDCLDDGSMNLTEAERVIRKNIDAGKIFLGFNLTGGSTNEMAIDPIKSIYDLNSMITEKYDLSYSPVIHVDSVLGWVYLLFSGYDFEKNDLKLQEKHSKKIQSLYQKVSEMEYADSVGIDFHKTGFCAYMSSMFMTKKRSYYFKLNPEAELGVNELEYGKYNPYLTSLEYSRSSQGPISALTNLKSLGKSGFRKLISGIFSSAEYFRELLSENESVCILDEDTEGFATLFLLRPPEFPELKTSDLKKLPEADITKIREYNIGYGKYLLSEAIKGNISFYFTSSRSYTLLGTNIRIGAMKAYPMSVFLDYEQVDRIIVEVNKTIEEFIDLNNEQDQLPSEVAEYFEDMTLAEKI